MKRLNNNQEGIVAVVVTVLIMLVISITTLGMARLASREQRQAVDRQLSTEALYAAESGINDIISNIQSGGITGNISQCSSANTVSNISIPVAPTQRNDLVLDSILAGPLALATTTQSKYTCGLVSHNPANLEYAQVTTEESVVADITSSDAAGTGPGLDIQKLVFGWEDSQSGIRFKPDATCRTQLDPANNWNATPMIKLDITPLIDAAGSTDFSRANLMQRTMSYFLSPCSGSGTFTATPITLTPSVVSIHTDSGAIYGGNCDTRANHPATDTEPLRCNVNINLLALPGGGSKRLLIRAKPIYGTARIAILGINGTSPQHLVGAQTVIDVTGKANDVLRRTQVRVSNRSPYLYAIESTGAVCKRIAVVQPGPAFSSLPAAATANPVDRAICQVGAD